jgi:hypothetical protein
MDLFSYNFSETPNVFRRSHPPRKRARRARTPKLELTDPLALWRSLPAAEAERLGALTVAFALSVHGMNGQQEINPIYEAFEHVMQESSLQLGDFLALYLPDAYRTKGDCFLPKLPNLNAIGIRQCTSCGCTDMSGCREGCAWAGPTLCTACIPESLVPDLAV